MSAVNGAVTEKMMTIDVWVYLVVDLGVFAGPKMVDYQVSVDGSQVDEFAEDVAV